MAVPIEIDVWQGDIAELEVDAILVPANESLFMTTPVGRAVKLRAGEEIERDAVQQGPVAAGSAVATGAGALAASYVIHVVGVGHDLKADVDQLARALDAALDRTAHLDLKRLAVAPIGVERGVFDAATAATALADVLVGRGRRDAPLPTSIVVAVAGPVEAAAYRAAMLPLGAGR